MSISYDTSNMATGVAQNPIWSHTCTGNNLALIVSVVYQGGYPSDVSYNGVSLTNFLNYSLIVGDISLWIMLNPPVGTYNVSVIGIGDNTNYGYVTISNSYTGVKQINQPVYINSGSNSFSPYTISTTISTGDCWVFTSIAAQGTIGSSMTMRNTSSYLPYGYLGAFLDSNGVVPIGLFSSTITSSGGGTGSIDATIFALESAGGGNFFNFF